MSTYRQSLPQLTGDLFLTDGGIETTLIFHEGFDLPLFASFVLLRDPAGREGLKRYFKGYADIATDKGTGFIFDSPTWRANPDWGWRLGHSARDLADINRDAIELMVELRAQYAGAKMPMVVSGNIGPRGDAYDPAILMDPVEAEYYHAEQIKVFAETEADMVTAMTMTNTNEAIGVARAARSAGIPAVISFTVETDGRLPSGECLGQAIEAVDEATGASPAYYMINCAHPEHFEDTLAKSGAWVERLKGLRANASTMSHAELDEAEELDEGDPEALGAHHANLVGRHPTLNVFGGCCGTDPRHISSICVHHQHGVRNAA